MPEQRMPEQRQRKPLLQRFKPLKFLGRLRRKNINNNSADDNNNLLSPVGVADFWQDYHDVGGTGIKNNESREERGEKQNHKDNVNKGDKRDTHDIPDSETNRRTTAAVNVDDNDNDDSNKIESRSSFKSTHQSTQEVISPKEDQVDFKGSLLREFSYPTSTSPQGNPYVFTASSRPVSPMTWTSYDFRCDKVEQNCEGQLPQEEEQEVDSDTTYLTPLGHTESYQSASKTTKKEKEDEHPSIPAQQLQQAKRLLNMEDSIESHHHQDGNESATTHRVCTDHKDGNPNHRSGTVSTSESLYQDCNEFTESHSNYHHQTDGVAKSKSKADDENESTSETEYLEEEGIEEEHNLNADPQISKGEAREEEGNEIQWNNDKDPKQGPEEEVRSDTQSHDGEDHEQRQEEQQNPEDLFSRGQPVTVQIVGGTYQSCKQGQIVKIQKRVQLLIQNQNGTSAKHWLARRSLCYRGTPFPAYQDKTPARPGKTKVEKVTSGASEDPKQAENDGPNHIYHVNDRVWIVGGKYKGKAGTVTEVRKTVKVAVDGFLHEPWLQRKSLSPVIDGQPTPRATVEAGNVPDLSSNTGATPKTNGNTQRRGTRSNSTPNTAKLESILESDQDWRLVDSAKGGEKWGQRRAVKIRLESDPEEDNLLSHWMGNRVMVTEIKLEKKELKEPIPRVIEDQKGNCYEVIASKVQSDGEQRAPPGAPSLKCLKLYYCQVSGPNLQTVALQNELERIADFGSVRPDKACARLEHFLSPAYKFKTEHPLNKSHAIFVLKKTTFQKISEKGNEGCGFICKDLLTQMLGGRTLAERAYAIQVRGSSGFGFFKGMLMAKEMQPDDPLIQIPPSMLKLGPSRASNPKQQAFLLITNNGVHPNSTNHMMGKLLRGEQTTKTFRKEKVEKKKFSPMFRQLLLGLNVPEDICDNYIKACKKEENLHHAFVVGLSDPTGNLPNGTVYIPGLQRGSGEIFVSRSPCIEATDGRCVPLVASKPEGMSEESWAFLESLPFGSIIFSDPKPGETPMPVMIADGDLDGDLYFICWNDQILNHVQVEAMNPQPGYNDTTENATKYRQDWFEQAQLKIVDAQTTQTLSEVIGKLYNSAFAIAKDPDKFMNKDHKAFAKAYKEALKIGKHGGKIPLPKRLHNQLPAKFCDILGDVEE